MPTYNSPGVFVEEIPRLPLSVTPVDTAIPAFIGYTEIAQDLVADDLKLKPKRISSLVEYEQFFGGPQKETKLAVRIEELTTATGGKPAGVTTTATLVEADCAKHVLYYAMQMYVANGGGPCWIVSAGPYKDVAMALVRTELQAGLGPLSKVDEPTLIVVPEAQALGLTDFIVLQEAVLEQCCALQDRFTIMDIHGGALGLSDSKTNLIDAVTNFRGTGLIRNLQYGAAYAPNIETELDFAIDEAQIDVEYVKDAAAPMTVKLSTLQQSSKHYELAKAAIRNYPNRLPPSSAVAGVYAAVDAERGVWKAPANVGLSGVVRPTIAISDSEQDVMNSDPTAGKSVNAIRAFPGRGTLVWGARTLAGNDNEWRYVPVRRFFIFVEESVKKATAQFAFERNDAKTWVKVQAMIESFLIAQWRQGALQGIKPEQAFYVAVGLGKTMDPHDILEGRMIVELGMAAIRPAEFIILRVSHKMAQS